MKKGTILIALALLCLAGCGGSSHSQRQESEAALTMTQFNRKADKICHRGTKKAMSLVGLYLSQHSDPAKSEAENVVAGIRVAYLPMVKAEIREIRALGAPPREAPRITAFLKAQEHAVSRAHVENVETAFDQAGSMAKQLGWPSCDFASH